MRESIINYLRRYILVSLVGVLAGLAASVFLYSLEFATHLRESRPWLILLLPAAGLLVGYIYHRWGQGLESGNNLLLDEIHDPKATIPLLLVPLILFCTLLTHIFGGSAGREGTAVQMGGSLADQLAQWLRVAPRERRILLIAGMSAGFGAVFGVPFAGAVFGIEVLRGGRKDWALLLECLIASWMGHLVSLLCGTQHTLYPAPEYPPLILSSLLLVAISGAVFGTCAWVFAALTHFTGRIFKRIRVIPVRPAVGGMIVVFGFVVLGTDRFAGLGIPVIVQAMREAVSRFDFAWKLLFTAVTLGSGFKGGEVTPLLYIGATLGNSLGQFVALPFSLLAALGFVAVFAGAANTPLACTVMAMELFGPALGGYALLACAVSYYFSGHTGIYSSQRIGHAKFSLDKIRPKKTQTQASIPGVARGPDSA